MQYQASFFSLLHKCVDALDPQCFSSDKNVQVWVRLAKIKANAKYSKII